MRGFRKPSPDRQDGALVRADGDGVIFGCRATRLVTRSALGMSDEVYAADAIRRQVELVSCLANPADDRFTYDLRLLSQPDPDLYTRGSLDFVLLGRVDGDAAKVAESHAQQVLRLLQSTIIEADWDIIVPDDLPRLASPFEPQALVSITRRCELQALDSLRAPVNTPRLGFGDVTPGGTDAAAAATVFHTFRFLPGFVPHSRLFQQLLLHPHPILVSCRLQPTRLTANEARFLEEQISECEKHAQLHLGQPSEQIRALRPTLQRRAQILEQSYLQALHTLGDDAAVVTLEIASPAPIPQALLDAIGHFVSEPAAIPSPDLAGAHGLERFLAGGYEIVDRMDDEDALEALKTLRLAPASHPGVPAAAARLLHLFEPGEAVAAFRFPLAEPEAPAGIEARRCRYRPAPPELEQPGVLIGVSGRYGMSQEVRLAPEDRLRHLYVVGQTGTGKTTLLRTMILDDMRSGAGLCVIDPHGDLYADLLGRVPDERVDDVLLIDPSDPDQPARLNLLEHSGERERYFIVQQIVGIVQRLMADEYGPASSQFAGPVFFEHLRNNLLLVMSHPDRIGTIRDFFDLFNNPDSWRSWAHDRIADPQLKNWVTHVLPSVDYIARSKGDISMGEYVASKFQEFVFEPNVRRIFDSPSSSFDFGQIINEGKIVLVNLSKGLLTEPTSRFLGMVILAKLMAAAMGRVRLPAGERRPFYTYVDEFQSLATTRFVTMLSEGRKFGLGLVLANQFVSQVEQRGIVDAIFGNVGSVAAFRVGQQDAQRIARLMGPVFSEADLVRLPNWHAAMTALFRGRMTEPFTVETVMPEEEPSPERAEKVRDASRRTHIHNIQAASAKAGEPAAVSGESPQAQVALKDAVPVVFEAIQKRLQEFEAEPNQAKDREDEPQETNPANPTGDPT